MYKTRHICKQHDLLVCASTTLLSGHKKIYNINERQISNTYTHSMSFSPLHRFLMVLIKFGSKSTDIIAMFALLLFLRVNTFYFFNNSIYDFKTRRILYFGY